MSPTLYDRAREAADAVRQAVGEPPEVAIVLGSGLGGFGERLSRSRRVEYRDLPHWPAATVVGHQGRLHAGRLAGRRVVVLAGRVHAYEGHDLATVTFGVRVMGLLGVSALVLTNASGGINLSFNPGDLMVLDDHLNLMGGNPLVGPHDERFGARFPDMSEVYATRLRDLADGVAADRRIGIVHGVYAAVHGPSFETPAEIRYLRAVGADAVGMSTVPEAIVARQMGMEVLGVSCVANMAAGILPQPLTHQEVLETTARVQGPFGDLLEGIVGRL